jgi:hypothetical protein
MMKENLEEIERDSELKKKIISEFNKIYLQNLKNGLQPLSEL